MGIRYYAYAFDAEATQLALADPQAFIGSDPFADAWGLTPGARIGVATGIQTLPDEDLLYLDKAWGELQRRLAPRHSRHSPRPAARMFEGDVTMTHAGWIPWVRALGPAEVAPIADDLARFRGKVSGAVDGYVGEYLQRAVDFTTHQACAGRGFAYLIG